MSKRKAVDKIQHQIADRANKQIAVLMDELLERNHNAVLGARQSIKLFIEFRDRINEIIDNLIVVHGMALKDLTEVYGDIILAEHGVPSPEDLQPEMQDGEEEESSEDDM